MPSRPSAGGDQQCQSDLSIKRLPRLVWGKERFAGRVSPDMLRLLALGKLQLSSKHSNALAFNQPLALDKPVLRTCSWNFANDPLIPAHRERAVESGSGYSARAAVAYSR